MDLQRLIRGELEKNDLYEEFLKKDQFEKRELLSRFILTYKNCKIGNKVFCFETEPICADKYKYFYDSQRNKNNQIKSITISSSFYQTFQLTGNTSVQIGNKNSNDAGYVYVPYIMIEAPATINGMNIREWQIEQLRKERKEKLEKLKNLWE